MTIENQIAAFIRSSRPSAFVLQGTWGRGKTHLWRSLVDSYLADDRIEKKKKYAYVSLFGIDSLESLKTEIFHAASADEKFLLDDERSSNAKSLWSKLTNKNVVQNGKRFIDLAAESMYSGAFSKAYRMLSFFAVRDMLICLDDIERRGEGLRLLDVMGLVSQLWEHRGCQVAVILNNQSLGDDQKVWDHHREKVFQGEITYEPSSEKCISLAFPSENITAEYQIARAALQELELTNIRVIERVRSFIDQVFEHSDIQAVSKDTKEHIIKVLALVVFCHYCAGDSNAPPIERAMRWSDSSRIALYLAKNDERTEQEKKWDSQLDSYGIFLSHPLDHVLAKMVVSGYPDEDELVLQVKAYDKEAENRSKKDAYFESWRLLHESYANNRDAIVDSLRRTVPAAAAYISANNMDATVRLLRALRENELATNFIQIWIKERLGSRAAELDPREIHQVGRIEDGELLAAIEGAYENHRPIPALEDALERIGAKNGWDDLTIEAIASSTPESIADYIEGANADWLSIAIRRCLDLGPDHNGYRNADAATRVKEALLLLAGRSEIHALRVKWKHGLPEDQPVA